MAPTRVFVTGVTGYIGSTTIDNLLQNPTAKSRFTFRALVRSPEKASQDVRPLGIEPVLGSLDDLDILERESAQADVVLNLADADHLPAVKAIIKGLLAPRQDGARKRPILIHTSGTSVLADGANGNRASDTIYHDNDTAKLNTLAPTQLHRKIDLEIIDPSLVGKIDTYIVAPPTIWGLGSGPGNSHSIQIPFQIRASLKHRQALQIGKGLNIWSRVHVHDLARVYTALFERALQEPQGSTGSLPKNKDAYYFAQAGDDFAYGDVAKEIAKVFKELGINDSGEVKGTEAGEEEKKYWPDGAAALIGGNSRSRAVKARELLGWEAERDDFWGYVREEVKRLHKEEK